MDFSYVSFGAGIFIILLSLFSWKIVSFVLARFSAPRKYTRVVGWRLMGALVTYALLVEASNLFHYFDLSDAALATLENILSAVCSLFVSGIFAGVCRLVGVWERSSQNQTLLGPLSQAGGIVCWTVGGLVALGYLLRKRSLGGTYCGRSFSCSGDARIQRPSFGVNGFYTNAS